MPGSTRFPGHLGLGMRLPLLQAKARPVHLLRTSRSRASAFKQKVRGPRAALSLPCVPNRRRRIVPAQGEPEPGSWQLESRPGGGGCRLVPAPAVASEGEGVPAPPLDPPRARSQAAGPRGAEQKPGAHGLSGARAGMRALLPPPLPGSGGLGGGAVGGQGAGAGQGAALPASRAPLLLVVLVLGAYCLRALPGRCPPAARAPGPAPAPAEPSSSVRRPGATDLPVAIGPGRRRFPQALIVGVKKVPAAAPRPPLLRQVLRARPRLVSVSTLTRPPGPLPCAPRLAPSWGGYRGMVSG
ncbi:hypothetical protein P7K49_022826 [Saguinus oedipus]|uniref:Uncharacterized protein n=1 Tax=Saguinus oedipus TaxID=9490 RepID=A0ABQ9UKS2_SAGOE|nr:hypothetical protein P7K49_022826 [Saguinus oedipus]